MLLRRRLDPLHVQQYNFFNLHNIHVPSPARFSKALRIHGKGGHANRTHGVHDREQHSFKVMLVTPSSPVVTNGNVEGEDPM